MSTRNTCRWKWKPFPFWSQQIRRGQDLQLILFCYPNPNSNHIMPQGSQCCRSQKSVHSLYSFHLKNSQMCRFNLAGHPNIFWNLVRINMISLYFRAWANGQPLRSTSNPQWFQRPWDQMSIFSFCYWGNEPCLSKKILPYLLEKCHSLGIRRHTQTLKDEPKCSSQLESEKNKLKFKTYHHVWHIKVVHYLGWYHT